jgi:Holliday junction resolvase RusA-like endonuclease
MIYNCKDASCEGQLRHHLASLHSGIENFAPTSNGTPIKQEPDYLYYTWKGEPIGLDGPLSPPQAKASHAKRIEAANMRVNHSVRVMGLPKQVDGAVNIEVIFYFKRTTSRCTGRFTRSRSRSGLWHTACSGYPDIANLTKFVLHSLQNNVFKNKAYVAGCVVLKRWTVGRQQPCTIVRISKLSLSD